jgi:hypothetical protein
MGTIETNSEEFDEKCPLLTLPLIAIIMDSLNIAKFTSVTIGTIFKATSTTNFNKTPSAKNILL